MSGASAPERLAELQSSGFEWLTKPVAAARLRSWLIQAGARRVASPRTVSPRRPRRRRAVSRTELKCDILIADDHPLVRDALARIVRQLDARREVVAGRRLRRRCCEQVAAAGPTSCSST